MVEGHGVGAFGLYLEQAEDFELYPERGESGECWRERSTVGTALPRTEPWSEIWR